MFNQMPQMLVRVFLADEFVGIIIWLLIVGLNGKALAFQNFRTTLKAYPIGNIHIRTVVLCIKIEVIVFFVKSVSDFFSVKALRDNIVAVVKQLNGCGAFWFSRC